MAGRFTEDLPYAPFHPLYSHHYNITQYVTYDEDGDDWAPGKAAGD